MTGLTTNDGNTITGRSEIVEDGTDDTTDVDLVFLRLEN